MEEKIDHYIGAEIFDLNQKKKVAYSKIFPYRYIECSPPYVDELTHERILEYEKLFIDKSVIDHLKVWYTADIQDIFGYTITPRNPINYNECGVFGIYYDVPESPIIKQILEKNQKIILWGNYLKKGGSGKYIEVSILDSHLFEWEYFSSLEKYDVIKTATTKNEINAFSPIYLIDLENPENFGVNITTSFVPSDNNDALIFLNRDESYYFNLKKQYYQNFVDLEILTQEQYDYIFEVSPGAEKTILKFRWEGSKLSYIELESVCVFGFHKVWTRT